jgi:hypothetical protein
MTHKTNIMTSTISGGRSVRAAGGDHQEPAISDLRASRRPAAECVRLSQFHIIQISMITYGFFGPLAILLLS